MKKSLIALAALATVGAAQAQSSVTVYGILDVGYMALSADAGQAASSSNLAKRETSAITHGQQSTSRLGFRGTEDLGGGLKANFVTEIGLTPTEATFSGSSNYVNAANTAAVNASGVDNRMTYLGLQGKFGEIRIGRQFTAVDRMAVSFAAGGGNALVGEIQYTAANSSNLSSGTAFDRNAGSTTRASNAISYISPRINGLQLGAGLVINNKVDTGGAAAGNDTQRLYSLAADYTAGKARIAGAYGKGQLRRDIATASSAANVNVQGTVFSASRLALAAASQNQEQWIIGASYNFGFANVMVSHMDLKAEDGSPAAQLSRRKSDSIGVQAPLSAKVTSFATYGKGTYQVGNTSAYEGDVVGYQLGANYNFSKRTNAYAIYGYGETDVSASRTVKDKQYAVGIRHSF